MLLKVTPETADVHTYRFVEFWFLKSFAFVKARSWILQKKIHFVKSFFFQQAEKRSGRSCRKSNPFINSKNPGFFRNRGSGMVSLTMSYFHWKYNQLSSAIRCFTVLFGMGRSGTTSLWSSGKGFAARAANSSLGQKQSWAVIHWLRNSLDDIQSKKLHGYRIKLHEQLVMVSWVPHSTYTPILSTSWSRTTL